MTRAAAPSEQQPAVEDEIVSGVTQDAPAQAGQPYACRLLVNVNVLHVDGEKATAYLELTPYQAQAMRALQAAALPLYAEGSALLAAGLSVLFPPLGVLIVAGLLWLLLGGRRRSGEKYAGLRILK